MNEPQKKLDCGRCETLRSILEELISMADEGPCCGSGDEMTSHYHCGQCGKVGGMYVCNYLGDKPTCKPDPDNEYIKRQGVLQKANDLLESLGVVNE